jgi:hypothetical protein
VVLGGEEAGDLLRHQSGLPENCPRRESSKLPADLKEHVLPHEVELKLAGSGVGNKPVDLDRL